MTEHRFAPLHKINSRLLLIDQVNVDTDQIYPAKFLSITERDGLGKFAFYDWRFGPTGELSSHFLNSTPHPDRQILLVGQNFGSGSSREHAPWALYDFGVRAIIGVDIADIFYNNCLNNGIAAIRVTPNQYAQLRQCSDSMVEVDLETCQIIGSDDAVIEFEIDALALECLLNGQDTLDILLNHTDMIKRFERDYQTL